MKKFILITLLALSACNRNTSPPEPTPEPESVDSAMPAAQDEPAYVGFWASDPAQCDIPQEQENAPMIMTAGGYDQHEAHCTFDKIEQTAPGAYKMTESCEVEGDKQSDVLEFTVNGDELTLSPGTAPTKLVRCAAG